jgi:signal transduction histidine kinase
VQLDNVRKGIRPLKYKNDQSDLITRDIGNEVFATLESDLGVMSAALQEDITQLISIAKLRLSGDTAIEVNTYLSLAIQKLRLLAFEIKPKVLADFGLATALEALLTGQHKSPVGLSRIYLHELPKGIEPLMETAVFRLVQQILRLLSSPEYNDFGLRVERSGGFICLRTSFKAERLIVGSPETDHFRNAIIKAIQPVMYCFNGHCHFALSMDQQVALTIYLYENGQHDCQ